MGEPSQEAEKSVIVSTARKSARATTQRGQLVLLALAALLAGSLAASAAAAASAPLAAFPAGLDPNAMLSPPLIGGGPVKVTVALHVLNLASIDEVTERFQLTGYLLTQWRDPRLTYQPGGPAEKFRTLTPGSVWQPRLVIINVVGPRHTYETSLRVEPDGLMSYVERFDAALTSTFHLKSFPFDAQKLEIIIHPFTVQQPFVTFVPSQLPVWTAAEFNTYSSLESWQFKSITFGIRSAASQFGKNTMAEARFQIAVERRYGFYLWKVFLPLLLMVIMSWSVFWFDPPEVSSQVTIAVTTILTIIAFALAISLTLPRIPYLTFADAFFLTCYVFAFITMVELTAVHIAYRNERRKVAARIRRTARWLVPSTFVAINVILIAHFLA
jgi:Neurotransmitter-gated ion-channel ligand binding domain/Neurotransmitter-gated ion-channel transmembrane region